MRIPIVRALATTQVLQSNPRPLQCGRSETLELKVDPRAELGEGPGTARGFVMDAWMRAPNVTLPLQCDRPTSSPLWRCVNAWRPEARFFSLLQPDEEAGLVAHVWLLNDKDQLFGSMTLPCERHPAAASRRDAASVTPHKHP